MYLPFFSLALVLFVRLSIYTLISPCLKGLYVQRFNQIHSACFNSIISLLSDVMFVDICVLGCI